jgi:hypothetical protein
MHTRLHEAMRNWAAVALLAIAVGATLHFWPLDDRRPIAPTASGNAAHRDSAVAPSGTRTAAHSPSATSALSQERAPPPGTVGPSPLAPLLIDIRAPDMVRSGDTFAVTIDVQAAQSIRHLAFSVTYNQSILRLVGSSPGAFAQQGGSAVQFEESSDGYLLVRIDPERAVFVGAGSVAVLEFEAIERGVSPLSVQDVTHVEVNRRVRSKAPAMRERSLTVD